MNDSDNGGSFPFFLFVCGFQSYALFPPDLISITSRFLRTVLLIFSLTTENQQKLDEIKEVASNTSAVPAIHLSQEEYTHATTHMNIPALHGTG